MSLSNLEKPRDAKALFPCALFNEACKLDKLLTPPPKLLKFDANSLDKEEFSKELVVRLAPKPLARLACKAAVGMFEEENADAEN